MRSILLALALLPAAASAQTEEAAALADIPNLTIETYEVSGTTPAQIRKSLNALGPTDPNDGTRVDAVSRWSLRWTWRNDANGVCIPATARVEYKGKLTLPHLANEAALPAQVRAGWHKYLAILIEHEAGHLRPAAERAPRIAQAMQAATCETIGQVGQTALAELQHHDVVYDAETRHGRAQGAVYP